MSDLLNKASLVMVPSGYKEDTVYSVIPTDGSGDLSFTRASNGTRINSAGLVEVCPWNLATNSENFSSWNLANVTVTTNDITAPNGTLTADKLTISNNANDVKQTISVMPNSVYTWTFYVYGGTALGQQMRFYDNTNSTNIEYYNYSSSVVLGAWAKIERTFTTPSGCYEIQAWVLAATSTIGTMWVWGAQLNIGSTAKPYFPTTDRLNVPRLTYQNGGGGCPSLLLEKQSTNLVLYSEQFDNADWSKIGSTITANATISPDGTQNADKLIEDTSTGNHRIVNTAFAVNNGNAHSQSWYVKYFNNQWIQLNRGQEGSGYLNFDLINGVVGYTGGITDYQISNMANGWYRISINYVVTGTYATAGISILDTNVNARYESYVGDGTSGVYIWGCQYEQSSYPTSYIPTTSASATRVADACSKTGISSLIGGTSGTVFFDIKTNPVLTSENYKQFFYYTDSSANQGYMYLNSGNGIITNPPFGNLSSSITLSPNTRYKIALTYANNDFALYVNGVSVATASSGTPLNFENLLSLGNYQGTSEFNQFVFNQYTHFPSRLTNAELASLTTI